MHTRRTPSPRPLSISLARLTSALSVAGALATAVTGRAAVDTWDGGGLTTSWLNPLNWVDDTPPTLIDDVLLDESAAPLPQLMTLDAPFIIQSLTLNGVTAAPALRPVAIEAGLLNSLLTINGTGAANPLISVSGGTTPNGGYLRLEGVDTSYTSTATNIGTANIPTRLDLAFGGPGTVTATPNSYLTINASIAGTSGLNVTGGGLVSLGGANTFSGNITATGGSAISIQNDSALGLASNSLTLDNGQLVVGDYTTIKHPIAIGAGGGTIDVSRATLSDGPGRRAIVNADISGSGALTKTGEGTLYVVNPLTHSGTITVGDNGGALILISNSLPRNLGGDGVTVPAPNNNPNAGAIRNAAGIVANAASLFEIDNRNQIAGYLNDGNSTSSSGTGGRQGGGTTPSLTNSFSNNDRLGDSIPVALNGATLRYRAADMGSSTTFRGNEEVIGTVTVTRANAIDVVNGGGAGNGGVLRIGALNRTLGSTVTFTGSGTVGNSGQNGRIGIANFDTGGATPINNDFIGGWALVGTDFAVYQSYNAGFDNNRGALGVGVPNAAPGTGLTTYKAYNNTFAAGNTVNFGATTAIPAGGTTISGFRLTGANTNITFAAPTDQLTLQKGGLILDNNVHNVGTAGSRGRLTSTSTPVDGKSELFLHVLGNTTQMFSEIVDNGTNPVAVVKAGGGGIEFRRANTFSGGLFLTNSGDVKSLGDGEAVADRTDSALGRGPVTISNTRLILNHRAGAVDPTTTGWNLTDNFTYTVQPQAELRFQNVEAGQVFPAGQTIKLTNGSFLQVGNDTLTLPQSFIFSGPGQNVSADFGASILELSENAAESVVGLPTTPTYWLGNGNTNLPQETVTVGAGTPWLGLTADRGTTRTINRVTLTANSDFSLRGSSLNTTPRQAVLVLGNGTTATNQVSILASVPGTPVKVSITDGVVRLNNDVPQLAGVTFVVNSGAELELGQANSLGTGANAAKVIVQAGGILNASPVNAISGDAYFEPGGQFTADDGGNPQLTGAGVMTFAKGSIINMTNANGITGTQRIDAAPGTILRFQATNPTGVGTDVFDPTNTGRLPDSIVWEIFNASRDITGQGGSFAPAFRHLVLNTDPVGGGGILTNDQSTGRILSSPNAGFNARVVIGPDGGSIAATTNTLFQIREDIEVAAGRTLTIGSNEVIAGLPKLGNVTFGGIAGNRFIDPAANVVILNGAQVGFDSNNTWGGNVYPDANTLNLPIAVTGPQGTDNNFPGNGTTLLLQGIGPEAITNVTGPGAILSNNNQTALYLTGGNGAYATNVDIAGFGTGFVKVYHAGTGTLTYNGTSTPGVAVPSNLSASASNTVVGTLNSPRTGILASAGGNVVIDPAAQGTLDLQPGQGTSIAIGGATPATPRVFGLSFSGGELLWDASYNDGSDTNPAAFIRINGFNLGGQFNTGGGKGIVTLNGTGTLSFHVAQNNFNAGNTSTVLFRGPGMVATPGTTDTNGVLTANPSTAGGKVVVRFPFLWSGGGNSNAAAGGIIPAGAGTPVAAVRSDFIGDANAAGTGTDFVTEDGPASGLRNLTAAEYGSDISLATAYGGTANFRPGNAENMFTQNFVVNNTVASGSGDVHMQSLKLTGASTLNVTGPSPLAASGSRLVVYSGGILVPAGGNATITADYLDRFYGSGGAPWFMHTAGDLTINAKLNSSANFLKGGPGTLNLNTPGAINNMSGSFIVNDGTVQLAAGNSPLVTAAGNFSSIGRSLQVNGGTLNLNGNNWQVNDLSSGNPLANHGGTLTNSSFTPSTVRVQGVGFFGGVISGNVAIEKSARDGFVNNFTNATPQNMLSLTSDNTYTGATIIRNGSIRLVDSGRLSRTLSVDVHLGGALLLDESGLGQAPDRLSSNTSVNLRNGALIFQGAAAATSTQNIGVGGIGGVNLRSGHGIIQTNAGQSSDAQLTIDKLNRAPGATANFIGSNGNFVGTILGSKASYQALGLTTPRIVLNNIDGAPPAAGFIGGWAIANNDHFAAYLPGQGVGYVSNTDNGFVNYSSTDLSTAGATDLVNDGAAARTIAAAKTVLAIRHAPGAAQTITLNAPLTITSGGLLTNANFAITYSGTGNITAGAPDATPDELFATINQNTTTIAVPILDNSGAPLSLVKAGAATLAITANNAAGFTGTTYVNQGTLVLNATGANGTTTVAISGPLVVNGGVAQMNSPGQLPTSAVPEVHGGAALRLNNAGGNYSLSGLRLFGDGGVTNTIVDAVTGGTAPNLTLTGTNAITAVIENPAVATGLSGGIATTTFGGPAGTAQTIDVSGWASTNRAGGMVINGVIAAAPAGVADGGLRKTGPGTLILGGNNTLTQGIDVAEGALRVDTSAGALGPAGNVTTVQIGADLILNTASALTGSVKLNGGTLRPMGTNPNLGITNVAPATGTLENAGTSTITSADWIQPDVVGRTLLIAHRLTGTGTINIAGPGETHVRGTVRLGNPIADEDGLPGVFEANSNTFAGTFVVQPNAILLNQAVTGTGTGQQARAFGSQFGNATIQLNGGTLQIRDDLSNAAADVSNGTVNYGNPVMLTANSFFDVDRTTGGSNNNTVNLGTLTVPAGSVSLTGDFISNPTFTAVHNSYRLSFDRLDGMGTLIKGGHQRLVINSYGAIGTEWSGDVEVAGAFGRTIQQSGGLILNAPVNAVRNLTVNGIHNQANPLNVAQTLTVGSLAGSRTLTGGLSFDNGGIHNLNTLVNHGIVGSNNISTTIDGSNVRGTGHLMAFGGSAHTLTVSGAVNDGTGATALRVAGNQTVQLTSTANAHTGGTEVQSGTLQIAPIATATNPLGTGSVRVFGSPALTVASNGISQAAYSGTLQLDASAGAITQNSTISNNGTVRATGGTVTVTRIEGTPTTFVPGLLEGRMNGVPWDPTDTRIGNAGNFGVKLEPRMAYTNVVTQNPFTGWSDNDYWAYTGYFRDPDGDNTFSFAENIDDDTLVAIDGVTRLVSDGTVGNNPWTTATTTAHTVGFRTDNDTNVANGNRASAVGGNPNFGSDYSATAVGLDLNGDGDTVDAGENNWHSFEVRFRNGGGGAGSPGNRWGWGANFGFGLNSAGTTGFDGSLYTRLTDPGDGSVLRAVTGGSGDITVDSNATLNTGSFAQINEVNLAGGGASGGILNVTAAGNSAADTLIVTGIAEGRLNNVAGSNITFNGAGGSLNVAPGSILTKSGDGLVTFASALTGGAGGTFNVTGGTVQVDGDGAAFTATTNVLGANTVLQGNGSLAGPVLVREGSISPGTDGTTGDFGTGDLTIGVAGGTPTIGTYRFELGGPLAGLGYDQLQVGGAVNLVNAALVGSIINGYAVTPTDQFTIILNDGTLDPVQGTFNGLAEGAPYLIDATPFQITYQGGDGNDVVLISQVPEPGSIATLLGGIATLVGLRRFRRQARA